MRDRLIRLLCGVKCEGEDRREGGCAHRVDDKCVRINGMEMCQIKKIADHLLANGVIVPPCKVGDTVYYINTLYFSTLERNRVYRAEVTRIVITKRSVSFVAKVRYMGGVIEITEDGFGKNVFLTREEAEQALKGGESDAREID